MEKNKDYIAFCDKFKVKHTTDDCYTPDAFYEDLKDWVVNKYHLEGCKIIRPFYPGGDYENENYPEGCVVIDNPPFSIFAKIIDFYREKNIKFFLFGPQLTGLDLYKRQDVSEFTVCHNIIYSNGAKVKIAFFTNMEERGFLANSLELNQIIMKNFSPKIHKKYNFDADVVSASRLEKALRRGIEIKVYNDTIIEKLNDKERSFGFQFRTKDKNYKRIIKEMEEIEELKSTFAGSVTIFDTSDGVLKNKNIRITPGTKTAVMKDVKDIISEAMKNEDLFNIQITIQKR